MTNDPLDPITAGDSLTVDLALTDGGAALNLAGATVVAGARSRAGVYVAATATVVNAAGGLARVHFAPAALGADVWELQVSVTLGSERQTPLRTRLTVEGSILP